MVIHTHTQAKTQIMLLKYTLKYLQFVLLFLFSAAFWKSDKNNYLFCGDRDKLTMFPDYLQTLHLRVPLLVREGVKPSIGTLL